MKELVGCGEVSKKGERERKEWGRRVGSECGSECNWQRGRTRERERVGEREKVNWFLARERTVCDKGGNKALSGGK